MVKFAFLDCLAFRPQSAIIVDFCLFIEHERDFRHLEQVDASISPLYLIPTALLPVICLKGFPGFVLLSYIPCSAIIICGSVLGHMRTFEVHSAGSFVRRVVNSTDGVRCYCCSSDCAAK